MRRGRGRRSSPPAPARQRPFDTALYHRFLLHSSITRKQHAARARDQLSPGAAAVLVRQDERRRPQRSRGNSSNGKQLSRSAYLGLMVFSLLAMVAIISALLSGDILGLRAKCVASNPAMYPFHGASSFSVSIWALKSL